MNVEELENKNNNRNTIIVHFLIWFVYLILQLWWRFDSYGIYDIIPATIQVITWATLFYTVRLYLYPKYLWKNHVRLFVELILFFIIFQAFTYFYINYFLELKGDEPADIISHLKKGTFWLFNISFVAFGFTYYDELGKAKAKVLIEEQKRLLTEAELAETNLKLRDAELENLRAQLNPHFLFNVLWYIIALVQATGNVNATKAVQLLSDMMRYSMQNRGVGELVPLADELKYAKNFIDLQMLRTPVIKLDYQVVEKDIEGIKILPLVLISFIENSMKHGKLNEEENPLMIHLTVKQNKSFTFFVRNKISTMGKEWSSGIGLENVKSRLQRAYGNRHSLIIENDEIFYTTKLMIEL